MGILWIFIIIFIIFIIFLDYGYSFYSRYIRILLISGVDRIYLKIEGDCRIVDFKDKKTLLNKKNINTKVFVSAGLIYLLDRPYQLEGIFIEPKNNLFILNGRKYRGKLLILKGVDSKLMAINFVNLEDYVKGILHREVSKRWPMEALKAQAVVCRTYALYAVKQNRMRPYDLTADVYSQVYGGYYAERYRTNQAVKATYGQILTFKGEVFPAYFHSTCGGYTEEASLLWNIDLEPLKGVKCDFCRNSPHFKWQTILELKLITEKLKNFLTQEDLDIKEIVVLQRSKSGRILSLKIITDKGKKIVILGKDFRNAIGPNIIRSTNFNLKIVQDKAVFEGIGWGHGVGMCQWGAYFMAQRGYKYDRILRYYFPASELKFISK